MNEIATRRSGGSVSGRRSIDQTKTKAANAASAWKMIGHGPIASNAWPRLGARMGARKKIICATDMVRAIRRPE